MRWIAACLSWIVLGAAPLAGPGSAELCRPIVLDPGSSLKGTHPCVASDATGRLWVGMRSGGIFVGDGHRFLAVDLPDSLRGANWTDMVSGPGNRIYAIGSRGLACFQDGRWTSIPLPEGKLPPLEEGLELKGNPRQGVVLRLGERVFELTPQGSMPLALPTAMTGTSPLLVWGPSGLLVSNRKGLWRRISGGWQALPPLDVASGPLLSLAEDQESHLYAWHSGVLKHLRPGAPAWDTLLRGRNPWGSMTTLADGQVALLADDQLHRLRAGARTVVSLGQETSLYHGALRHEDALGRLWMTHHGLVCLPLGSPARVSNLPAREVWSICRDGRGRLWVGGEGGVFRLEEGWRTLSSAPCQRLAELPDGRFLFRSDRSLMEIPPSGRGTRTIPPPAGWGSGIRSGPIVRGQDVWVTTREDRILRATLAGSGFTWREEPLPSHPRDLGRPTLKSDGQGGLWLTGRERVYRREVSGWTEVEALQGKRLSAIQAVEPGRWLATTYEPCAILDIRNAAGTWRVTERRDPLDGCRSTYALQVSPQGRLWIGSGEGLWGLDPGGQVLRIGSPQGLPSEELNQGALLCEPDGRLWIGTMQGLATLHQATSVQQAPMVLATRIGNRQTLGAATRLEVKTGVSRVTWDLGSSTHVPTFAMPLQARIDQGPWFDLAGHVLQSLEPSPGTHRFQVRPALGTLDQRSVLTLDLVVLPPWYHHPLALITWGLLGALAMGGLVHLRTAAWRRRNRSLQSAVEQATSDLQARQSELEALNAQLQASNEAKQQVLALAGHDLRNPLASVLLHCEMLDNADDPALRRRSAASIRALCTRMTELLKRLLDLHALESGRGPRASVEPVALRELAALSLHRHAPMASQKAMELVMEAPERCIGLADPSHLQQILDNYLSNALKFSPHGSTIRLAIQQDGEHWRLAVQDQGPGLSAEDQARAFRPYARLSAKPTGGESSTGLGLSLVRHLAKDMGADVGVESTPGEGATFWVRIPSLVLSQPSSLEVTVP